MASNSWSSDLDPVLIRKCCSLSFKAHKSDSPYALDTYGNNHPIFAFAGSWSIEDWFSGEQFGDAKLPSDHFPSLKVLGTDQPATVNGAFLAKFLQMLPWLESKIQSILSTDGLCGSSCVPAKVDVQRKKRVVFTGHSSGGAVAMLATLWFLEKQIPGTAAPLCVTFGSPLVGDTIFGHAIRREGWSNCIMNFVLLGDPVPRIHLSPLSEIQNDFNALLLQWKTRRSRGSTNQYSFDSFHDRLLSNTFSTASCDSCVLRRTTAGNALLQAVNGFLRPSPYRPFGSFFFCCEDGKMVRVENHDSILQILFYSMNRGVGVESYSDEHMRYMAQVEKWMRTKSVVDLDQNSMAVAVPAESSDLASAFEQLAPTLEARLSLIAAREVEILKQNNLKTVEGYVEPIKLCLQKLDHYRCICEAKGVGYYDSFKLQKNAEDFEANATRLELVGYWEVVREMLKAFELPDHFELLPEWVDLGTEIRLLVEPIDIANYYRHDRTGQTGLYDVNSEVRPKYYKYPEKWLHHRQRSISLAYGNQPEDVLYRWRGRLTLVSCFWARVENLIVGLKSNPVPPEVQAEVLAFKKDVMEWLDRGDQLARDVLLEGSSFMKLLERHSDWKEILERFERKRKAAPLSQTRAADANNRFPSSSSSGDNVVR